MLANLFLLSGFPLIEDFFADQAFTISSNTSVTPEPCHSQKLLKSRVNLLFLIESFALSP